MNVLSIIANGDTEDLEYRGLPNWFDLALGRNKNQSPVQRLRSAANLPLVVFVGHLEDGSCEFLAVGFAYSFRRAFKAIKRMVKDPQFRGNLTWTVETLKDEPLTEVTRRIGIPMTPAIENELERLAAMPLKRRR